MKMKTRMLMLALVGLSLLIPQVWGVDLKMADDLRDFDNSFSISEKQVRYDVPYKITNGTISDMQLDCDSASLVLYITSVNSGIVKLDMPQRLLSGIFMVLIDGNEWDDLSITQNVLSVNFPQNTNSIEIRGSTYITPYYVGSHLYTGVCDIAHDPPYSFILSPLKQFNSGIPYDEIKCKDNLVLIQKHDGTPACVTSDTVSKLSERDWSHPCPNGRFNEQRNLCVVGSPGIGSDSTELSNTQFEEIKNDIESTGYDICDIRIENDKIIIDLHKFFKDSEPKKKIISKIPSNVNYEIIYHEGYSDYSINTMTSHECEGLENAN